MVQAKGVEPLILSAAASKTAMYPSSNTPGYKHKCYPMLAFYYPCRLDTIIITTSFDSCLSWSAAPLLINHAKAVLPIGFQLMYIPFTSPHYNRTLAVRPIVWEWYIGNSKTSYRCHCLYMYVLLTKPALSLLGADHLITFGVD